MSDTPDQQVPTPALPLVAFGRVLSSHRDLGFLDFAINRVTAVVSLIGVIVALALPPMGMGFNTCTMMVTLGVPCPGCGLTRSVTSVYQGQLLAAWQYNPFGLVFALGFAMLAPLTFFPARLLARLREKLEPQSYRIGVVLIVFTVGLMLHGITRAVLVGNHSPVYAWWWDGTNVPPAFQHLSEDGED